MPRIRVNHIKPSKLFQTNRQGGQEGHSRPALVNYERGLIDQWSLDDGLTLLEKGFMILPEIVEDRTQTTCIRIPLGFVKAILILQRAPVGTQFIVYHFDRGLPQRAVVRIDEEVPAVPTVMILKALDIDIVLDRRLFLKIEMTWYTFVVALVQFSRRGCRRVERHHLTAIVNTAVVCQIQCWNGLTQNERQIGKIAARPASLTEALMSVSAQEVEDFLEGLSPLLLNQRDEYSIGIFHSFEVALILSAYLLKHTMYGSRVRLRDYYNARMAAALCGENFAALTQIYPTIEFFYNRVLAFMPVAQ